MQSQYRVGCQNQIIVLNTKYHIAVVYVYKLEH
jgi:hypothetical protein